MKSESSYMSHERQEAERDSFIIADVLFMSGSGNQVSESVTSTYYP